MNAVIRAWLGFCALGAGLIHLALVIGSPLAIGIPLLIVGIAEFAWGVFAFTATSLPFANAARIGAIVPILGWVVLLVVVGPAVAVGVRILPMLVASLLDLAVAIGVTVVLRRQVRDAAERPLRPGRYLLSLGLGALVVAALTTPALAATEAGDMVVPHGDEQFELPETHPDH